MNNHNYYILISGGYGNNNSGDEALLQCILIDLRNQYPRCRISVLSDNVTVSKKLMPDEHYIYSGRFGLKNNNEVGIKKYYWIPQLIKAIKNADILITGGGTILQDETHRFFIPFWYSKIILAQIFKTPTMFYGIGAGPINRLSSRLLNNISGSKVNYTTVRGPLSYQWISKFNFKKERTMITADPVVTLKECNNERINEILKIEGAVDISSGELLVGISVRQWYQKHIKSIGIKEWVPGGEVKYAKFIREMADACIFLIEKHNAKILFIPLSVDEPNDDRVAAQDIIEVISKEHNIKSHCIYNITGDYSPPEIKGLFSLSDIVIGMRFHSVIYATSLLKPTVGIAYGLKTWDYMTYIGMEKYVVDVDAINSIILNKILIHLLANRAVLTETLNYHLKHQIQMAKVNIEVLQQII